MRAAREVAPLQRGPQWGHDADGRPTASVMTRLGPSVWIDSVSRRPRSGAGLLAGIPYGGVGDDVSGNGGAASVTGASDSEAREFARAFRAFLEWVHSAVEDRNEVAGLVGHDGVGWQAGGNPFIKRLPLENFDHLPGSVGVHGGRSILDAAREMLAALTG